MTFNKFPSKYGKFCKNNPKISIVGFLVSFLGCQVAIFPPKNSPNSMFLFNFLFCKCWCLLVFFKTFSPKNHYMHFSSHNFNKVGMEWTTYSNSLSLYNQLRPKEQKGVSSKYFNSFSIFPLDQWPLDFIHL